MKTILLMLALIFILALAPNAYAQAEDAAAIVKAYYDALNNKNLDAAYALLAADAQLNDTHPPPGAPGTTEGEEAIKGFLQGQIDGSYRGEFADFQVNGSEVTYSGQEWLDPNFGPPGFPFPIESHFLADVENSKIKSITTMNDPAWLEKLYAGIPPEAIDPVSVLQLWEKAENAHDLEGIMKYFGEQATVTATPPLPGVKSSLQGTAELRSHFENDIKNNARYEFSDFSVPEPDHVKYFARYSADAGAFPANFPFPIETNVDAIVKDGKIQTLTVEYTPAWLAQLQPAAGTLPATGLANPGAFLPVLLAAGILLIGTGAVLWRRNWAGARRRP